mgnify:CR=1 FL=1
MSKESNEFPKEETDRRCTGGSLTSLRRSDACKDRLFSNETIALAAGGNDKTNRDTRSLRGRRMGEQERKRREIGLIRGDSDRGDLVENGSDTASSAWCTINEERRRESIRVLRICGSSGKPMDGD